MRVKNRKNPWITPDLIKKMNFRDVLHVKATKKGKNSNEGRDLWDQYKKLRNQITSEIRKGKQNYYKGIMDIHKKDHKKFWREISKLMPSKINAASIPNNLSAVDFNIYILPILVIKQ
jgi:hypothetical protein